MKHINFLISTIIILTHLLTAQNSYMVYFNEVRADDASTDDNEFIELIGPAGTDITGLVIAHYNGAASVDGGLWTYTIGSFIIPNDCAGIGFFTYGSEGNGYDDATGWSGGGRLQNGPDGLILYDTDGTTILDAIAWEGEGDMTSDDPGTVSTAVSSTSNNYLHVTIDDDDNDNSLNAPINVVGDDGTGWTLAVATPGVINIGQICIDVALPVELSSFTAEPTAQGILLMWTTESEIENLGFILERKTASTNWQEIVNYKQDDALMGQGTVSFATDYEYLDKLVQQGNTYEY
ncbi:lamin tail domain-containing protein, partial [bacterium]|nr:lamin tail domain-containing protein [bacterium]